jgi:serine phosphatase RsbU (regulator of sigma subunit)/Tfp pilus assembly protein PilF
LIDSCLTLYHSSKHDTDKVNALFHISENMMHDGWFKYQLLQHDIIEEALSGNPTSNVERKLQKNLASSLCNIGYEHLMKGEYSTAITYYNQAKLIAEALNYKPILATYYLSLGFIYNNQGKISKALDYYDKGLKLSKEIDDKNGVANSLQNIAGIYSYQGDYDKAIEFCFKSLKTYEAIGDHRGTAYALNSIGSSYFEKKEFKKALKYYKISIDIRENIGDKAGLTDTYNNIGLIYKIQGNKTLALDYFYKSLKIQEEIGYNGITISLNNIGTLELEEGNILKAKKYGIKGLKVAQELGFPNDIKNAAWLLHKIYEKEGKGIEALEMYKLSILMRDSINNEETQKASAKQQAKYEYEKQKAIDDAEHDKLLAIEKEEKAKQKILTTATAGGLGLVVVFLIFVFNRLRVTKKQKLVIEEQKAKVEQQKDVVEAAHHELEEKNQEIMDSITYAKRIQLAILPPDKVVKEYLQESFILYKPKDIVAGDFYWLEQQNDKVLFAAADCTGHGVPGAMVSVVCNNALNRSVREHGLTDPGEILNKTREIVVEEFEKSDEDVKDGMDIALCSLEGNKLQYAGAHNPLWIIRKGEIIETKANKQPIGKFDNPLPYTTHTFELQKGDTIYIFSDGYVDQFGGEKGKKFKAKAFRELLLSVQDQNMEEQKTIIDNAFETWRGNLEQIDDVCVIGVRI